MKKLALAAITGCLLSFDALAGSTGWVKVTEVLTGTNNDRVNIIVDGNISNPANCAYTDFYQVNEDGLNKDKIFSMALVALTSSREFSITFSDTNCSLAARPLIQAVKLR